jgi:hypothetical protein
MEVQLTLGDALDDARLERASEHRPKGVLYWMVKYVETHGSKILQDDKVEDEAFVSNSEKC